MTDATPLLAEAHRPLEPVRGTAFSLRAACSCGWRGPERRGEQRVYAKVGSRFPEGLDHRQHLGELARQQLQSEGRIG